MYVLWNLASTCMVSACQLHVHVLAFMSTFGHDTNKIIDHVVEDNWPASSRIVHTSSPNKENIIVNVKQ